jgi:hypothetical protein
MMVVVPMVVVMAPGSERGAGQNKQEECGEDQLLHGSNLARAVMKRHGPRTDGHQKTNSPVAACRSVEKRKLKRQ